MILVAFVKDVKEQLKELHESWKTSGNQVELVKKICDVIGFHADVIQLRDLFN